MSLSTVFSLLTSASSEENNNRTRTSTEEEDITITNVTGDDDDASTFTITDITTTAGNITISTPTSDTNTPFTSPDIVSSSNSINCSDSNFDSINSTFTITTTETSPDFFDGTDTTTIDIDNSTTTATTNTTVIINDSSSSFSFNFNNITNGSNNGNISINSDFANELEFQNLEDDADNNSLSTASTDYLGDVREAEPTTYVPLFYFLLTIVLGIYVFLYFLQRHIKAKAMRDTEDEQKKKVEDREKRGGCRYDFEDEDESDYGPQEQNLSVSALRFYGGGGRK